MALYSNHADFMVSHRGDRVNPGDVLDFSLYVDIRIAEEEPEEEPEEDP